MKINHSSPIPIYEQLGSQISQLIESGKMKEGEALPSVRKLAKQIGVANNTIVKAYNDLESRGFIKTYGNKGAFVLEQEDVDCNNPLYDELRSSINTLLNKGIKNHTIRRMTEDIITQQEK